VVIAEEAAFCDMRHCTIGQERMPPAAKGQSPLEFRHDISPLQCNGSALTGCLAIVQQSRYILLEIFLYITGTMARNRLLRMIS